MLRTLQRPNFSNDDSGENAVMTSSPQPTVPPSSTSDQSSDQRIVTSKDPLFIPDPEDDISPANLDIEPPCADLRDEPMITEPTSESSEPRDHHQRRDLDREIVTIDTTRASWNRQPSSPPAVISKEPEVNDEIARNGGSDGPEDKHGEEDIDKEFSSDEERPRKKRKSDTGSLIPWISTKPASISGKARVNVGEDLSKLQIPTSVDNSAVPRKVRQGKLSMHNFLVGFASSSSQRVNSSQEQRLEEVEVEEDVEMEEEAQGSVGTGMETREGSDRSMTIHESANTPVLPKQHHGTIPTVDGSTQEDDNIEADDLDTSSVLSSVQQTLSTSSGMSQVEQAPRPEIIRNSTDSDTTLKFDLERIRTNWCKLAASKSTHESPITRDSVDTLEDAGFSNTDNEAKAAEVLSRIIDKPDFSTMEVVGQFNLGFIISRRRKSDRSSNRVMDDLFIVDQHAADEKYNFETLQQTTNIQSQKLFRCVDKDPQF